MGFLPIIVHGNAMAAVPWAMDFHYLALRFHGTDCHGILMALP